MLYVVPLLLILGGLLAASSLASGSRAKDAVAALAPYGTAIGVALLLCGLWRIAWLAPGLAGAMLRTPMFATIDLVGVLSALLLGLLLGAPVLGARGVRIGEALAPARPVVGVIALLAGLTWLAVIWGVIPNTI